ncbi:MAG: alpha/beta fold hydrolase [Verrucomicrobiota bacterium]
MTDRPLRGAESLREQVQRRLLPERLQAVHEARQRLARERVALPNLGVYEDYRAVIHVHAEDSDHTKGTRPEVLDAAKKTGVRVVLWTDHRGPKSDAWRGLREGVLFIAGSEDGGGVLRFPEFDSDGKPLSDGGMKFLSHIEERLDAASDGFVGMEISNRHTDAVLDKTLEEQLVAASKDPQRWAEFVEVFRKFPDEVFGVSTDYHTNIFARWDRETQQRAFTGIGANDAHQNQIFGGVTFDPYEVSFRNLSTHILARDLTESEIRQSLREGHVYVSHDWLCDPTGFAFGAGNNLGVFTMGDTVPIMGNTRIMAVTPVPARLKLLFNGNLAHQSKGTNLIYETREPGAYRVEAWIEIDGEERPWIYANPVYLKLPTPDMISLPTFELAAGVELKKNLDYTDGPEEDAAKHQLDLYIPKADGPSPVFFFVHGGAWRYGDRSQYPPLGNRLAKAGFLTVIPSYRLAPKHPHPAQIEDVASAFAWTVRHIAQHGGNTNRIYIGGHSAGGHLSALLALDRKWLERHQIAPTLIRGVAALSGVFNLTTIADSQSSVFGTDFEVRRSASPFFQVREEAPPFLVTYCQWDYLTLPAQAREFHRALRDAKVTADLVYVARQNHISTMLNFPKNNDATAEAVLGFLNSLPSSTEKAGR